jgi:oxygen-independent coproporphyrinogen-3 oxidase
LIAIKDRTFKAIEIGAMDKVIAQYAEQRVPRYTSYPTAPHFAQTDGESDWRSWLSGLNPLEPVSLYLHVPFCRQVCWYCACNMKLAVREGPVLAYAADLEREIELMAEALPARLSAGHVHWGGGTPTAMPHAAMAAIMQKLRERFILADNTEIAFELDPRTFRPEMAAELASLGATRASLGVQEFDARVQQAVNRIQPYETVKLAVDALREAGISGINFDLMYGLPHQSVATLTKSVRLATGMRPERIALFGYAHVPWMARNQRLVPVDALPDADQRFDQAETAAEALVADGYVRIGLDHFALPGDEMTKAAQSGTLHRNFQGYTTDGSGTLIGLGATSISSLPQGYAQNISETGAWSRAIGAGKLPIARQLALTEEDRLRRDIIERLMCNLEVDLGAVANAHGRCPTELSGDIDRCRSFANDGLAEIEGWTVSVTERGRPALRVIASAFDAYLRTPQPEKRHAAAV